MPNIVIHIDYMENIEAGRLEASIKVMKIELEEAQAEEAKNMGELSNFQRAVDMSISDLMLELATLKNELNPDPETDRIKEHYEGYGKETPIQEEPTKFDRNNEDKELRKLYMKLAKLYHPDKAPKGKEEEYTEIFKTLGAIRKSGNLDAMKQFAKTLKKAIHKGGVDIKKLKKLRANIEKQIKTIKDNLEAYLQSDTYKELLRFRENQTSYIEEYRVKIKIAISNVQQQIDERDRQRDEQSTGTFSFIINIKN